MSTNWLRCQAIVRYGSGDLNTAKTSSLTVTGATQPRARSAHTRTALCGYLQFVSVLQLHVVFFVGWTNVSFIYSPAAVNCAMTYRPHPRRTRGHLSLPTSLVTVSVVETGTRTVHIPGVWAPQAHLSGMWLASEWEGEGFTNGTSVTSGVFWNT